MANKYRIYVQYFIRTIAAFPSFIRYTHKKIVNTIYK